MNKKSPINGIILHSSAGSFAEATRIRRLIIGAKPIHADLIIDAEWVEPSNCNPIPVAMPEVKVVVPVGTPSLQTQGFSTVEGRKPLTKDQVRTGGGHPAFVMVPT